MRICPCKDCPKSGCGDYHGECEDFLKWKEELNKAKELEKADNFIFWINKHKRYVNKR